MTRFDPATQDFLWLLRHVIPTDRILDEMLDLTTVEQVAEAAAEFIGDRVAPLNRASDTIGARLVDGRVVTSPGWRDAWSQWAANGWAGLGMSARYGGQDMPFLVQAMVATMLGGADIAFAMVSASARGAGSVLGAHAGEAFRARCLPKLASGEWTATIVITEPEAGSDVGLIRTRAVPQVDGSHALSGTKIFISGGDHDLTEQILHIVLARVDGAPSGVKGLSLFLVPSVEFGPDGTLGDRNAISVARIEEKMGLHGSATCMLNFDGARGWLIGSEGQGLTALFTMMNELRIEVALSAVGLGAGATRHAIAYAEQRLQGRDLTGAGPVPIIEHPDVRRMVTTMRCLVEGGRALVMHAACLVDLEHRATTAEERRDNAARLAWLLPICKAATSDHALEVTSLGIQIRGGHGYVRESGAEQFYRDARVLPIYEGANGIHAGALATRGLRDGGAAVRDFVAAMTGDLTHAAGRSECGAIHACLTQGIARFGEISDLLSVEAERTEAVLAVSYDYLTLAGHIALGWMWLRMAAAQVPAEDSMIADKRALADFFAQHYGPEIAMLAARIELKMTQVPKRLVDADASQARTKEMTR